MIEDLSGITLSMTGGIAAMPWKLLLSQSCRAAPTTSGVGPHALKH